MNMKTTACSKCGSYMKVPSHYVGQEAKCVSCGYSFKVILATSAPIRVIKPKSSAELDVKANNKSSSDKKLATRLSIGCGLLIILFSLALLYNQNLAKQNSLLKTTLEKHEEDISKKDDTIKKINDDLIEEKSITKKLKEDIYKSEQAANDINKQFEEYKIKSNSVMSDYIEQLKKTEALSSSLQSKIDELSAVNTRQKEQKSTEKNQLEQQVRSEQLENKPSNTIKTEPPRIITAEQVKQSWINSLSLPGTLDRNYQKAYSSNEEFKRKVIGGFYDERAWLDAMEWNIKEYDRVGQHDTAQVIRNKILEYCSMRKKQYDDSDKRDQEYRIMGLEREVRSLKRGW